MLCKSVMLCVPGFIFASTLVGVLPGQAAPEGRSWSPVITNYLIPGHTFGVSPKRLETDALGRPLAFVEALGGIGRDMYALGWSGSGWSPIDHLGYGTKGIRPVPSLDGSHHLVGGCLDVVQGNRTYMVMARFESDSISTPDTVTTFYASSLKYTATASTLRRWAAMEDFGDLRLLYSDQPGVWSEIPVGGRGDEGSALGAIDDTTALLAWRDVYLGPGAGILRGSIWTVISPPPMTGLLDTAPLLRRRPGGGYWLSWATMKGFVGLSAFDGIGWSAPESVYCSYLQPEPHYSQSPASMSSDGGEYPAVGWMAASSLTGQTSVCVCIPDASGFPMAENLPGSEDGVAPVVARDRNEDVWVLWKAPSGMGWTHTYTHATASAPSVVGPAHERIVAWTLSEPAPGSWWAVLRAQGSEPFEEVARLRAGDGLEMTWTDAHQASATLRYRVRRESVHIQYEWLSDEGAWPTGVPPPTPLGGSLLLVSASSNPAQSSVLFEVLNAAAGALETSVYDIRGRLLLRQKATASGSGRDFIQLDPGSASAPIVAGLYFLRVRDAAGRASASARFVYLR